jgi:o-succinylbenzoate---CoA ligase
MNNWLAHQAQERPDAPALIAGKHCLSWQELAECARKRAAVLADHGLRPGHVVAVEAESRLESVCWMHAVFWLGATLFPLPPRLPAAVLDQRLARLAPNALVVGDPGQAFASVVSSQTVVVSLTAPAESTDPGPPSSCIDGQDILTILWTSGSSGAARAVPLTMANHVASTRAIAERLGITANDRWLLCLPLEHIGGLAILVRAMITGASVDLHEHFDPDRVRADLATQAITLASMVPTMLARLIEHSPNPCQSNLRALLIGGAPAAPQLLHDARTAGLPVVPTWGMTETCSQLATLDPAEAARVDFLASPGLVGPPLTGVELRIEPDPSCPDTADNVGRLLVRGPMVFGGYLKSGIAAREQAEDWFDTGDVGRIDAQGRVIMAHRASDLIISGGVNINAREVETILLQSPWVDDVAVLGLPHPTWGEQVVAVIAVSEHDHHLDDIPATLTRWCREHLAPAQIPRRWQVLTRLPRNAAGKCPRDELAALFARPTCLPENIDGD